MARRQANDTNVKWPEASPTTRSGSSSPAWVFNRGHCNQPTAVKGYLWEKLAELKDDVSLYTDPIRWEIGKSPIAHRGIQVYVESTPS